MLPTGIELTPLDPAYREDPDAVYAKLRAHEPVHFDKLRGQLATFIGREKALLEKRNDTAVAASKAGAEAVKSLKEAVAWVDHTHKVVADAGTILQAVLNMETGLRGQTISQ